jgi:hypothetical protein
VWFDLQIKKENLDEKLKRNGQGHIYELMIHLQSMKATNEELHKINKDLKTTTNELKTTMDVLVKGQECISTMMEELFGCMRKSSSTQVGGSNLKAVKDANILRIRVETSMGVVSFKFSLYYNPN